MRHYEIVFLVHPDQSEQVTAMVGKYVEMVSEGGGKVHRQEDWGRKQLAYVIKGVHKAHFALLNIECGQDVLEQIKETFKFNDAVLRHLIIRRDKALTEPSPLVKKVNKQHQSRSQDAA